MVPRSDQPASTSSITAVNNDGTRIMATLGDGVKGLPEKFSGNGIVIG
jgi:hypothetical protein